MVEPARVVFMNLWFGWGAFCSCSGGGNFSDNRSFMAGKAGRIVLVFSGAFCLLSVLVFGMGIQAELSRVSPTVGFPTNLFPSACSGEVSDYFYFIDDGFWFALVAAIAAFVSVFSYRIQKILARE